VEQYKNYKKRLLDELGVQPADRLKELLKGLL
jgi:DNA-binding SARP family transcriptional activator